MMLVIKRLLERSSIYLAILCTLGIAFLSLVKIPSDTIDISTSDKFLHGLAYFFLAIFWLIGLSKTKHNHVRIWSILISCLIYGIVIEVLQGAITTYRTASYLDILANSVGIAVAFIVFLVLLKKKFLIPS